MVEQARAGARPAGRRRRASGIGPGASAPRVAAGIDFILEGLYAHKRISRSDERGYHGAEPPRRAAADRGRARPPVLPPTTTKRGRRGGGRKRRQHN